MHQVLALYKQNQCYMDTKLESLTSQMHAIQMFHKCVHVEEELLAEVTPGVRQDFSTTVGGRIAFLNMASQILHVIDPLLPDKDSPSFETDHAESLLMCVLHVASQTVHIWEVLL